MEEWLTMVRGKAVPSYIPQAPSANGGAGGSGSGAQSTLEPYLSKNWTTGLPCSSSCDRLGLITRSGKLTANCPYELSTAEETMVSAGLLMALTRAGVFKD
jgi:hypothetical protein